jgi:hypothetical protein
LRRRLFANPRTFSCDGGQRRFWRRERLVCRSRSVRGHRTLGRTELNATRARRRELFSRPPEPVSHFLARLGLLNDSGFGNPCPLTTATPAPSGGRARARAVQQLVQSMAAAASTISLVTAAGREITDRCDALTCTVWAFARSAMKRCWAGGITLSRVPTRYQLGIVPHAGAPEGSASALSVTGR